MASSPVLTSIFVTMLVVCGSLNTILLKVLFGLKSTALSGEQALFEKPWFMVFVMFLAMSLAMPCSKLIGEGASEQPSDAEAALLKEAAKPVQRSSPALMAIPACCDIFATGLCSVAFLYIPASVWQLLRGGEMVCTAVLSVVMGRHLYAYQWMGVCVCVLGIFFVGLAGVLGDASATKSEGDSSSSVTFMFGVGLTLFAQILQAGQMVCEEWLLKDMDMPSLQIIGWEGIWGGMIMLLFAFPVLYLLPGSDSGHVEDEYNSIYMLSGSSTILLALCGYLCACSTYNMVGIAVTGALSATHRVLLDAVRTAIIWSFGLVVHYCIDPTSSFGESWTSFSCIEVLGFSVLVLGQLVYGGLLRIPGLAVPGFKPQ